MDSILQDSAFWILIDDLRVVFRVATPFVFCVTVALYASKRNLAISALGVIGGGILLASYASHVSIAGVKCIQISNGCQPEESVVLFWFYAHGYDTGMFMVAMSLFLQKIYPRKQTASQK